MWWNRVISSVKVSKERRWQKQQSSLSLLHCWWEQFWRWGFEPRQVFSTVNELACLIVYISVVLQLSAAAQVCMCSLLRYCPPLTPRAVCLGPLPLRPWLRGTSNSQSYQQLPLRLSKVGELHRCQSRNLYLQLCQHLPSSSGERWCLHVHCITIWLHKCHMLIKFQTELYCCASVINVQHYQEEVVYKLSLSVRIHTQKRKRKSNFEVLL